MANRENNPERRPRPIQIVASENHSFKLQNLDNLEQILRSDELKDRQIVVVSIAGALRQGKSFLLNFFLKYLVSKYKKHNVKDWIGHNDEPMKGFNWRGGKDRETIGIWMWSDIFTHNFRNGEKVAIILMDTQGIFDNKTSFKECISIFAISMLLSSVLCYNVMRQVKESDLTNLQLFTEYARFAMNDMEDRPFQKLLFVVRDWPSPCDHDFGSSKKYADDLFTKNDEQTTEQHELRDEIVKSFDDIDAFLMPYPGNDVAQQSGDASKNIDMDPDFVNCVKILTEKVFAPENLIRKTVGGEALHAANFIRYLKEYVNVFSGTELPEPQTVLEGTTRAYLESSIDHFLEEYLDEMSEEFPNFRDPKTLEEYCDKINYLNQKHKTASEGVMIRFDEKRKLGGSKLHSEYMEMLRKNIQEKYEHFCLVNEKKKPSGGCTIL